MKPQTNRATTAKDAAPESEGLYYAETKTPILTAEQKFREKCKILKRRIQEVEESNELATLAISRTKVAIRRLRLEYAVLLERLEQNAVIFPDNYEEMSPPPSPVLDPLNDRVKPTPKKATKSVATPKVRVKDPNLPKRPTNAYLIFCEKEKERIKSTLAEGQALNSIADLGKHLIEAWKALDEEAKQPYIKLFEDDKERYHKEMAVYNNKKDIEALPALGDEEQLPESTEEPADKELTQVSVKQELTE